MRATHTATSSSAVPAIHVHLGSDIAPLGDAWGQRRANCEGRHAAQPLSGDESDDLVKYPGIEVLLQDLGKVMSRVDFSPFCTTLVGNGHLYVDSVAKLSEDFLVDVIGLPVGITARVKDHAARLVRRAERSAKHKKLSEVIDSIETADLNGEKENLG